MVTSAASCWLEVSPRTGAWKPVSGRCRAHGHCKKEGSGLRPRGHQGPVRVEDRLGRAERGCVPLSSRLGWGLVPSLWGVGLGARPTTGCKL